MGTPTVTPTAFDPIKFKTATRAQWENAAEPWHRWGPFLEEWLGPATERMLDLAGVQTGSRVLDVAAECVRFERESFGALHQMMATLSDR